MKKIIALVVSTIMLLSLAACAVTPSSSKPTTSPENNSSGATSVTPSGKPTATGKTLVIGTMANSLGLPVHQADLAGYFKEAGLDVKIEIFATGAPINEAMAAGNLDVAVSGMASVYGLATGMYTYIGDGVITTGGESIYARADSDIVKAGKNDKGIIGSEETIKGASILGPLATTAHYQGIKYAEAFGLTTEDFSMVSMEYAQAYQAFITGEGDLLASKMPYTNQLEEAGYVRVSDMNLVSDSPIIDTIFTQNKVAQERGADLELFLDCYYKACADLMKDETKRREIAQKWYADEGITYSQSDMDTEIAVKEYFTLADIDLKDNRIGSFMMNIGEFFVTQDMITKNDFPNVEKSINHSFLDNVKVWSAK